MADLLDVVKVENVKDGNGSVVTYECPWCGLLNRVRARSEISWGNVGTQSRFTYVVTCEEKKRCGKPTVITSALSTKNALSILLEGFVPESIYPPRQATYGPAGVPEAVARDFREALNCRAAGYVYSAALVARRTLQAALRAKGATGRNLAEEIDSLDAAVLSPNHKRAAHAIRFVGNDAAHAEEISEADADALIRFTREVLHQLYVLPYELDQAAQARTSRP